MNQIGRWPLILAIALGILPKLTFAADKEPLTVAQEIDRHIQVKLASDGISPAAQADDAAFLRRVSLDLTGRLPSPERAQRFLDDTAADKRAVLIDELLASPDFGQHFARYWTELLVKRDGEMNKKLKSAEFRAWLAGQFNEHARWDRIVTDLLVIDGETPNTFFFQANKLSGERPSPAKVIGASGNLLLGIQLQCAECHDHPYTPEWTHEDFWSMAAFFGRTRFERGKEKSSVVVTEADPPPPDPAAKKPPKPLNLPLGGKIEIPDPLDSKLVKGTAQAKFLAGDSPELTEKGPHRPQFAAWLTAPQNPWFDRAAVNRLWAMMFARGLVNPLDDMNPLNEPTHPELLALLADEFRAGERDVKHLLRSICNSQAYGRTSAATAEQSDDDSYARMKVKFLQGPVLVGCLDQVLGVEPPAVPVKNRDKNATVPPPLLELFDTATYDDNPTNYSFGAPQLLRLMNDEVPRRSMTAMQRLLETPGTPRDRVEWLMLSTLSRRPTEEESNTLAKFIEQSRNETEGCAGVLSILLSGAEFVSIR